MSKDKSTKKSSQSGEHQAVKETTALTPPPATTAIAAFDFGGVEGLGLDSVPATITTKLPYLQLVQKGTPGADKKGHVLFQRLGCFYDASTGKIYDGEKGLIGVAISMNETFVERSSKADGNKFLGKHKRTDEYVKAGFRRTEEFNSKRSKEEQLGFGKVMAPEGTSMLVETVEVLVVLEDPETGEHFGCVIPFKSTGLSALQRWAGPAARNTTLPDGTKAVRPDGRSAIPLCANEFRLTAVYREEGQNSWYIPTLEPRNGDIRSSIAQGPLYQSAIAQHKAMGAGTVIIDESTMDAAMGGGEASAGDGDMVF